MSDDRDALNRLAARVGRLEDKLTRILDVMVDVLVEMGMDEESLDKLNKERYS